ncbi:MAG: MltA domain-containing protein, partial [Gallionellaceae bacterium]|nr:MltA domain-containing protein [Gallionellaceae bacterium]
MKPGYRSAGLTAVLSLLLTACVSSPESPRAAAPAVATGDAAPRAPASPGAASFSASAWDALPGWRTTNLIPAWPALLQSCRALKSKPLWRDACAAADGVNPSDGDAQRAFYQNWLTPWQVSNPDGSADGLITGYYEPRIYGSRAKTARFKYPLYTVPDDLLTIDLGSV